jgi:type II secretory pathway pseudopilin PulG
VSFGVFRRRKGLLVAMQTPRRRSRARPGLRSTLAGMTIVEIVVALSVLVVAASIFGQLLVSTTRMRRSNREAVLATEAARVVIEEMRGCAFHEIYRRYNQDPEDDPDGVGSAPGNRFAVVGLDPLTSSPGGLQGTVIFPDQQVTSGSTGGGKLGGGGTGGSTTSWQLREDTVDAALGCPRDFSGNNVIDTANHSSDYLILPVRVEVRWNGLGGERRVQIVTQLADYVHEDER